MVSSSGAHFVALDHVRALAILMVIVWHFAHGVNGFPVPFDYVPAIFPLAIFDEGHTGVALFMTLSGYLFAKLLDGRTINYRIFIWNRALRLLPLLFVVIFIFGIQNGINSKSVALYVYGIAKGVLFPWLLPGGWWSIAVEFHYYIILPLLLWMLRKSKFLPVLIVVFAILLRWYLNRHAGEVQSFAYWTIGGRIDQFALGMIVYHFRSYLVNSHVFAVFIIISLALFYWYFDLQGGFYLNSTYPSPSPLWIFLPTIEGIAYAVIIAWYETSFSLSTTGFSKFISRIGEYSYSIYLFHPFFVFKAAKFVNERIMDISNFYCAFLWSLIFLLLMMPLSYLSFCCIEGPFLKLRKKYYL